jgi:hypothetical protein
MDIKKTASIIIPSPLKTFPLRSRLKNLSRAFETAKKKLDFMNDDVKNLLGEVYAG